MTTINLTHPDVVAHFARKGPAYLAGCRFTLEALGIELPPPLARKSPGRKRSADPARVTLWRDRRRALAQLPYCPG
jgi:hypothetical protein